MKKIFLAIMFLIIIPFNVFGSELVPMLGTSTFNSTNEKSTAWKVDYRHTISENVSWSVSYLNEGHALFHKRDGVSGQVWLTESILQNKLLFGLGIGPYHYYDTTGNEIDHGWASIVTTSINYYTSLPLFIKVEWNRVENNYDSDLFLMGIGYKF